MQKTRDTDILVIGGGPAGMMAAGTAAREGASVMLVEKMNKPGRKLLLTGNGRCNITNVTHDLRGLVNAYGPNGKFLYNAFSRFGVESAVEFFNSHGLGTVVEDNGRVFPVTEKASDVLRVLERYVADGGVKVATGTGVDGILQEDGRITGVTTPGGTLSAYRYILCTGGKSYPKTGSTGDAYGWLTSLGHTVTPLRPVFTPITVNEPWITDMEGASLTGVIVYAFRSGKKIASVTGDAVVTSHGLSGPAVFNLSRMLADVDPTDVTIKIDLMPDVGMDDLNWRLIDLFALTPNRQAKNFGAEFLTPKVADTVLALSGIEGNAQLNSITKKQRQALCWQVKALTLSLKGLGGFDRALITRGGVSLDEVDPMTMRSKLYGNLYFAGEVLDLDGPTGGYNLQVCWSTGYVAGMSAAEATP